MVKKYPSYIQSKGVFYPRDPSEKVEVLPTVHPVKYLSTTVEEIFRIKNLVPFGRGRSECLWGVKGESV